MYWSLSFTIHTFICVEVCIQLYKDMLHTFVMLIQRGKRALGSFLPIFKKLILLVKTLNNKRAIYENVTIH